MGISLIRVNRAPVNISETILVICRTTKEDNFVHVQVPILGRGDFLDEAEGERKIAP
jgi:hypothetical protein